MWSHWASFVLLITMESITATVEKKRDGSSKIKNRLTRPPNNWVSQYVLELKAGSQGSICLPTTIAALFTVYKLWKQPKHPWQLDGQANVAHLHSAVLFSLKKEWSIATHYNVDEPPDQRTGTAPTKQKAEKLRALRRAWRNTNIWILPVRIWNGAATAENGSAIPQKCWMQTTTWPANSIPRYPSKRTKDELKLLRAQACSQHDNSQQQVGGTVNLHYSWIP